MNPISLNLNNDPVRFDHVILSCCKDTLGFGSCTRSTKFNDGNTFNDSLP